MLKTVIAISSVIFIFIAIMSFETEEYEKVDGEEDIYRKIVKSKGMKTRETYYKSGVQHRGDFTFWSNGAHKKTQMYENGVKHGLFLKCYRSGLTKVVGRYENNKKVGEWQWYSEEGTIVKTKTYG